MKHQYKYKIDELVNVGDKKPPCLIQNFLWKENKVIFLGEYKAGKSVFIQQLIFEGSLGEMFLDEFKVMKPLRIAYFQLEGTCYESGRRCRDMKEAVDYLNENVLWLYLPGKLKLNKPDTLEKIKEHMGNFKPDIIIIDPLYKAVSGGSLVDDAVATDLTDNLDLIMDHYRGCALILTHHEHKPKRDYRGRIIDEGAGAIFGSYVLGAWPDHIIHLRFNREKENEIKTMLGPKTKIQLRNLECQVQRSGGVERNLMLELKEPRPLYWQKYEDTTQSEQDILAMVVKKPGSHYAYIIKHTKYAPSTVSKCLRSLVGRKFLIKNKDGGYEFNTKGDE